MQGRSPGPGRLLGWAYCCCAQLVVHRVCCRCSVVRREQLSVILVGYVGEVCTASSPRHLKGTYPPATVCSAPRWPLLYCLNVRAVDFNNARVLCSCVCLGQASPFQFTSWSPSLQVNVDGVFRYGSSRWFACALEQLAASGVHGVAVDVWVRARPQPTSNPWGPLWRALGRLVTPKQTSGNILTSFVARWSFARRHCGRLGTGAFSLQGRLVRHIVRYE